MEPQEINSIEDLFAVFDAYLSTPQRPPLTGAQHNIIVKMMMRYKGKLVAFNNISTLTINQADVSNFFGNFLNVNFWSVDTSDPGYITGDKTTWKLLPFQAFSSISLDTNGNPVTYTFDLGGTITHGFYQIN